MGSRARQQTVQTLDFREIASPEAFQDLVAELLARLPGITGVRRTGRGPDAEVDIFATGRRLDSLLPARELSIIVQCKHLAKSGRAVGKKDLNVLDALQLHNADIYLLVTSTRVGTFYSSVIKKMQDDQRRRDQHAASWDAGDLERELLKTQNADLLQRYFPRGASWIIQQKKSQAALVETSLQRTQKAYSLTPRPGSKAAASASSSPKGITRPIHLVLFPSELSPVREAVIREQATELSVRLSLSRDLPNPVLWSFENWNDYKERLDGVESVVALVGPRGASAPGIWLEIVAAQRAGKLRAVLMPKRLYTVTKHGRLPSVLLGSGEDESLASLIKHYRTARASWGRASEQIFWLLVALTLLWYQEREGSGSAEPLTA